MKTTLELPDDLVRRVKMLAVERGQKLKAIVAELLEAGLSQAANSQQRSSPPKPTKLKGRGPLTINEIEKAIQQGRS